MAFDAYYLSGVVRELSALEEPRVEKIYQPARDTVILQLRCRDRRVKLLIAANPAAPRLHLTGISPENPAQPPMFCMLLRKHLSGGRLTGVTQLPMERWLKLEFDCLDELGDRVKKSLIAELMGRTCNLYLLSPDGRILDCLRRVGLDDSAKRQALPGLFYRLPDPVEKADPAGLDALALTALLSAPGADLLADRLMDTLGGLSPLVCREAALYAAGDTDARLTGADIPAIGERIAEFFRENLNTSAPWYVPGQDGTPKQFAFCPILQYGGSVRGDSFSGVLELYYGSRSQNDALRQKSQTLRRSVQNLLSRLTRKMAAQQQELAVAEDRERLRQLGDIVTANLSQIRRGQTVLEAEDFYDEAMPVIQIPLSPRLSPQENAAKFYKDYSRRKNAQRELTRQLALGEQEKLYLESVLEELDRAREEQALEEIRQELQSGGYLKPEADRKRMKSPRMAPLRFTSTEGVPIFVGRNNRQNEELTFRSARRDDIWLHAQKVPGSHVIIACGGAPVGDDTVTQAAQLAAHYSGAAGGQNVAVDVTPVKQVKKLPGGKIGMVIYHTYRTVVVNPYPDITVDALNAEKKEP